MRQIYSSIVAVTVAAILIFLVWYFSEIVWYVITSAILAIIGKPLVDLLSKIHISKFYTPKWIAALVTLTVILTAVLFSVYTFVPLIFNKAAELSSFDINTVLDSFSALIEKTELAIKKNLYVGSDFSLTQIIANEFSFGNVDTINSAILSLPERVMNFGVALFCVAFITFFFLKESTLFYDWVVILFPKRYEENARRALNEINILLIRYFIGLLVESTIKLVILSIGLITMGLSVEDSIIIALIASILNVVPYIGPLIGAIIGIFLGIMSPVVGVPVGTLVLNMVILFAAFQVLDNIIIQPYIYASSVKAHPLEIFLVILLAGSLAGILGMLLAIPAYTVMRVFAKEFFNNFRLVQKLTEKI